VCKRIHMPPGWLYTAGTAMEGTGGVHSGGDGPGLRRRGDTRCMRTEEEDFTGGQVWTWEECHCIV
jgi:hypothetical protein